MSKRCPSDFFLCTDTFSFSTIRPLARSSLSPTKLLPWWSGDQAPERDLPACMWGTTQDGEPGGTRLEGKFSSASPLLPGRLLVTAFALKILFFLELYTDPPLFAQNNSISVGICPPHAFCFRDLCYPWLSALSSAPLNSICFTVGF